MLSCQSLMPAGAGAPRHENRVRFLPPLPPLWIPAFANAIWGAILREPSIFVPIAHAGWSGAPRHENRVRWLGVVRVPLHPSTLWIPAFVPVTTPAV